MARRAWLACSSVLVALAAAAAETPASRYAGAPLAATLQDLRSRGLRIIYSSDVIRPGMRVASEPRSRSPRTILNEVLAAHGLEARRGPKGTLLVVRNPRWTPTPAPDAAAVRVTAERHETVDVVGAAAGEHAAGPSAVPLAPEEVLTAPGAFESVFRALPLLPGVANADELDSRLVVRGGGPDENLTVVDGVEIHNPFRMFGVTSAFNADAVERFELLTGAFDVRHGDRLSSALVIDNRRGTEDEGLKGAVAISIIDANTTVEGKLPVGRGSWLVSARQTYFDLVAPVPNQLDLGPYFEMPWYRDVHAKVSWELAPGRRLSLFGLANRERTESTDRDIAGTLGTEGGNDISALSFDLSTQRGLRSRTVLSFQRFEDFYAVDDVFELPYAPRDVIDRQARGVVGRDWAMRQDVTMPVGGRHVVDGGFDAHALRTRWWWEGRRSNLNGVPRFLQIPVDRRGPILPVASDSSREYRRAAAWLQDRVQLSSRLSVVGGLRIDRSGINGQTGLSPRLAATLGLGDHARVKAAYGVHRQSPGYEKMLHADTYVDLSAAETDGLRNERSLHALLAFEADLPIGLQLTAEAYDKRFSDLIVGRLETEAEMEARLPPEIRDRFPLRREVTSHPVNGAAGRARGVDLRLVRRASTRMFSVTGWLTYGYGVATRHAYGRTYPFEYDRRHNTSGLIQVRANDWELATTIRMHSGAPFTPAVGVVPFALRDTRDHDRDGNRVELVPIPALHIPDWGGPENLNSARLPVFARVDARLSLFSSDALGRWSFYIDVLNVLGRDNAARVFANDGHAVTPRNGTPHIEIGPATWIPRLPSVGARFRF